MPNADPRHACPHCTRTFGDRIALYSHVKAKHGRKAAWACPSNRGSRRRSAITSDQDRLALADIVALERGRAVATVIVSLSMEESQKLEQVLRAPAATDTAGAVERKLAEVRSAIEYSVLYFSKDGSAIVNGVRKREAKAIRIALKDLLNARCFHQTDLDACALPATPDDPAAGDGGGR